ncbi:MAG: type II toxin-antitoxin system VapC family toxin [Rhizomicrobium sp.]
MSLYLDTSLLVAAFTNESRTAEVQEWLRKQATKALAISDWVVTEFSAALSIKLRTGQLTGTHRAAALAIFARTSVDSFVLLPVLGSHFQRAARIADQHLLGLRAGDALHLAVASDHGATLCTLDARMSDGGSAIGIPILKL